MLEKSTKLDGLKYLFDHYYQQDHSLQPKKKKADLQRQILSLLENDSYNHPKKWSFTSGIFEIEIVDDGAKLQSPSPKEKDATPPLPPKQVSVENSAKKHKDHDGKSSNKKRKIAEISGSNKEGANNTSKKAKTDAWTTTHSKLLVKVWLNET